MRSSKRSKGAFTLAEILIVVIILAILAAIVIPAMSGFARDARGINLKENLFKIRVHIQLYREHHGRYPDGDDLGDQLTEYTSLTGETADAKDAEHHYGPYIEQMPTNPFTGKRTVRSSDDAGDLFPPGDENGGWWFNNITGRFWADLTDEHVDGDGNPYNRY